MTDYTPTHEAIAKLADAIRISRIQLAGLILGVCPGPHRMSRHGHDGPMWCEACRYTADGHRVEADQ